MEMVDGCYNCRHRKELYTYEELYLDAIGKGICSKKNKVVGDKYYCEHHEKKVKE